MLKQVRRARRWVFGRGRCVGRLRGGEALKSLFSPYSASPARTSLVSTYKSIFASPANAVRLRLRVGSTIQLK